MCCGWLALSDTTISEQLNTDPCERKRQISSKAVNLAGYLSVYIHYLR
jgi:hypothetical protein